MQTKHKKTRERERSALTWKHKQRKCEERKKKNESKDALNSIAVSISKKMKQRKNNR